MRNLKNLSKSLASRSAILLAAAFVTLGGASATHAQVVVGASGVTYDTSGGSVTESQSIIHDPALGSTLDGGLIKNSANTLSLTGPTITYTGATVINAGTLRLINTTISPAANISIASGAILEMNGNASLANKTVTGTGTILKTGSGSNGFTEARTAIQLGAGSLIDVQAGFFYGANPNTINGTNPSDNAMSGFSGAINVASGAIFDSGKANVSVTQLTGLGIYQGGSFGSRNLSVGLNNTSSTFDGIIRGNNFGSGTVNLIKVGNGTLTLTGNNTFTAGLSVRGGTAGSPSIVNLNPTTNFTIGSSTASLTVANSAATDVGILNQNGGVLLANGMNVGTSGIGTYNLNSGTLNLFGTLNTSGNSNQQATLVLNGTVNLFNNASILLGNFSGGSTSFTSITQTGGTVTFFSDAGTNAGGTGRIDLRTSSQYYRLNGGTLAVTRFGFQGQAAANNFGASGNFYLNGGTLRTLIATTDFFGSNTLNGTTGTTAVWNFLISTNGGTVDTFGNNVTMLRPASHDNSGATIDGGLTKTGLGTLTLAAGIGYNGPTTVNQGRLAIAIPSGFPTFSSRALSIASGATLELSLGTGSATAATAGAITVTGTGSLVKTGTNNISLAGAAHRINLSPGGVIDVQAGTFAGADFDSNDTGSFDNLNTWANNQGNINVASGATFDTSMATVMAGALNGSGRFLAGYFSGRTLTLGVANASGAFSGTFSFNGTTTAPPSLIKTGGGTQSFTGQTNMTALTVNGGAFNLLPGDGNTAAVGGTTPFAGGTSVSVAPNATDNATLNIGAGATINATTFAVADTGNAGAGTVNQTGGTVNANRLNLAQAGTNARASYNLSGGTLNIGSSGILMSVNSSATSAITVSGGALNLNSSSAITLGAFNNRPAALTQTAGTVSFYADAGSTPGGSGSIALANSDYSGGSFYRLNGGTLSIPGFSYTGAAANGNFGISASLYLNGGTLAPTGSTTDFFGDSTRTTGNGQWFAFAGSAGAKIDTGANSVSFNLPLRRDPALGLNPDGGLTKIGPGTLILSANTTSTYTGNTTVNGGTLTVQTPLRPVTGSLVVTGPGATANLAAPASSIPSTGYTVAGEFASITVNDSGLVSVPVVDRSQNNPTVLVTNSLNIADGTVDLGNSDMIIRGGASQISTIQALVASAALQASAGSFASAPFTTLATFVNDTGDNLNPYFNTYDGVPFTGSLSVTDVIVKYTYVGDLNLDGVLDGEDLARIIEGFSTGQSGWGWGDVDNSGGVVTIADFIAFNAAYSYYLSNPQPSLGNGQSLGGSGASVPEPTTAALLLPVIPVALRRRRR